MLLIAKAQNYTAYVYELKMHLYLKQIESLFMFPSDLQSTQNKSSEHFNIPTSSTLSSFVRYLAGERSAEKFLLDIFLFNSITYF